MSKLKAFVIHLFISIAIVTCVVILMLILWYPGAYFKLMGGKKLIFLISGIDVFLGPLLTLIVFKAGKKSLTLDLTCIAILQIVAMGYGLYVMFLSRPVFTVFSKDAFYVASSIDIVPSELAKAKKYEWRSLSITGPKIVSTIPPIKNDKQEFAIQNLYVQIGVIQDFPRFYDDYTKHQAEVILTGRTLNKLISNNPGNKEEVDRFLKITKLPIDNFLWLPISSVVSEMTAIVDAKTGEFIEIIDAKPTK